MKKLEVKEATKQGLEAGDKVLIAVEYQHKNNDGSVFLYSRNNGGITISGDTEVFLLEVEAESTEPKLEVGQYWHHPKCNTEIIVLPNLNFEFTKSGPWADICGEAGSHTEIGESFYKEEYDEFIQRGYVLGRHPDNIEATPEATKPKPEVQPEATEMKLEVGQYWHHPERNDEYFVESHDEGIWYNLICTKTATKFFIGDTKFEVGFKDCNELDYLLSNGYILGRHPDNIKPKKHIDCVGDVYEWIYPDEYKGMQWRLETDNIVCIKSALKFQVGQTYYKWDFGSDKHWKFLYNVNDQVENPEQWQPKELELVWSNDNKMKMKAHYNLNGNLFYTTERGYICGVVFDAEPYANQDASKIDFSVAGQWLINKKGWVVFTVQENGDDSASPYVNEGSFNAVVMDFNDEHYGSVSTFSNNGDWQKLPPEKIEAIQKQINNLKA
jgi:hypothetical protein